MDRDDFIIAVFLVVCIQYQVKAAIQKRLVVVSGQVNDPVR